MSDFDTLLALLPAAFPAEQGAFLVSHGRVAAPLPVTNILETDHLSFRQFVELMADLDFLKERRHA